jgi:acetoin utilization deacetylase AcuC-like enzyme
VVAAHWAGTTATALQFKTRRNTRVNICALCDVFVLLAGGYEIAALAAGGSIAIVDAALDGSIKNSYALVRPPGHHACADQGQ